LAAELKPRLEEREWGLIFTLHIGALSH
jgi:hypothetical protein